MAQLKQCPGCGHTSFSACWRIPRQPVVLNYRFPSPRAAVHVKRRDLRLRQCLNCGLIFNAALEPDVIPYDANYENRQCFSPAFQEHLKNVADNLITEHGLRGGRILEVGCGKGDFLRLLSTRAQASGMGYDTSYEGPAVVKKPRLRFQKTYVFAQDVREHFDVIICRHVVEHIGPIGAFLRELCAIATKAGDPVVIIETPAFEWIARHGCFWDVFYEHCNYFSQRCLSYLCQLAGFTVARQRTVFNGQYQLLELRVRRRGPARLKAPGATVSMTAFERKADASVSRMEAELRQNGAAKGWAVWGAGAKGVALVNRLRRMAPRFVIDSNSAKQGCFIPGSRVEVVGPQDSRIRELALVLIANPNYEREIILSLRKGGFTAKILTAGFGENKS